MSQIFALRQVCKKQLAKSEALMDLEKAFDRIDRVGLLTVL